MYDHEMVGLPQGIDSARDSLNPSFQGDDVGLEEVASARQATLNIDS